MNNKIFKKVVIIFAAIIMTSPMAKADKINNDTAKTETVVAVDNAAVESAATAEEYQIKLNFNFSDNKANFLKAVDILLIGFSVVFIVMIIFIFVSKGIDKMFPHKQ